MNNNNSYQEIFNKFVDRFLKEGKSIFSNVDAVILTEENIKPLIDKFVNNGKAGSDDFIVKLGEQLNGISAETVEIFATAVWLWRLPPSNTIPASRKKSVEEILELATPPIKIDDKSEFFAQTIKGLAAPGTYYNTNKPFELAYIIRFFESWVNSDDNDAVKILKKQGSESSMKESSKEVNKTASMYNALLHLFKPDDYEPILSNKHKQQIVEKLSGTQSPKNLDIALAKIREEKDIKTGHFYDIGIRELWDSSVQAKNVIYHGAPGTGKTYQAEEIVKARLKHANKGGNLDINEYFEIVQFHPSFGYEEFIDGIKPSGVKEGQVQLKLVSGIFKEMCQKAAKELKLAKSEERDSQNYYFIADEVNRAELSRVFGEVLLCLEEDKRLHLNKNGEWEGTKVKTLNSNLWSKDDAVISIGDEGYFGIPENLYFIGTMNDIDRSVDSFDMALRRRFYWQYFECDYSVLADKYFGEGSAETYIENCRKLNELITQSGNNGWGLGADYQLGHAYFMKLEKLTKVAKEESWEKHLEPLLREYLRSVFSLSEIDAKLADAKNIYLS